MYQSIVPHATVISDRQVSQVGQSPTRCVPRIDTYNPHPILRLLLVAPLSRLSPPARGYPHVSHLALSHPLPQLTYTSPREAEARDQEGGGAGIYSSLSVVSSMVRKLSAFATGLTAASALNAERIVTRFEDDLELEVHQDATDASPLHTVLLADPERGVVWGGSSEGERAGVILKMGRAAAGFAIVASEV
ncbi:hypothetical protein EV122DRAFT_269968 [Schizophyllum commune]